MMGQRNILFLQRFLANQPEEEHQTLEEVYIKPISLVQSRAKRTIKPPSTYIEACYALLASEGDPSCFQEAIESNERQG